MSKCVSGTAIGTYGSGIQSHSDFISKTKDKANVVIFEQVNLNFESTRACLLRVYYFNVLWFLAIFRFNTGPVNSIELQISQYSVNFGREITPFNLLTQLRLSSVVIVDSILTSWIGSSHAITS